MKKLMIMVPIAIGIAAFAVGCTNPGIDENAETEIQVIKKDEIKETDI